LDVLAQSKHWDQVTTGVVLSRIGMPPDIRFFTATEQAIATALCAQLLDQHGQPEDPTRVPLVNLIDARLAEKQTDGWRYQNMPEDSQAWRDTLAALDLDAQDRFGAGFAGCSQAQQATVVQAVQDLGSKQWHGLVAQHVWSLWTRYACTAFYSHPEAWKEIGFPGPAYPRGYKNPGVDSREPFEVPDANPGDDPVQSRT
jgi:hypothetical protein